MVICRHFTKCGGCDFQHLPEAEYREFKLNILRDTLSKNKIELAKEPKLHIIGPRKRRRCTLQVEYDGKTIKIGFFKKQSKEVVDIQECLIIATEIFSIIDPLRALLTSIPKIDSIFILSGEFGLDIGFNSQNKLTLMHTESLLNFAKHHFVARMSWKDKKTTNIIYSHKRVVTVINDYLVELPPFSFLQATKECELLMAKLISDFTKDNRVKSVIDLYAGCGSFSLLFSPTTKVTSVEGSKEASLALANACKYYKLNNVKPVNQDIFNYPITANMLIGFDLAIIDPPRNGATPQIRELAKSKVPLIAMISCNIESFVRDTKVLLNSNYKIIELITIDQFHWTKHLEVLAFFKLNN